MRDPYEILGVAKGATAKEIKSAFRKKAKANHPDQHPNDPKAHEQFSEISQAYEILGDEGKRKQFDAGEIDEAGRPKFHGFEGGAHGDPFAGFRNASGGSNRGSRFDFRSSGFGNGGGGGGFDASDIFSELFGSGFSQGGPAGGMGSGARGGPGAQRPEGEGNINVRLAVTIEQVAGADKVTALFPDGRKLAIKLPRYVEEGQVIRLKGQGNTTPYGHKGDALIKLTIEPNSRYRIEGRDLHVDVPVELKDAVLGAKVPVETPTGKVAISVPAWSSSDRKLRLKGKGLPLKDSGHGDLYAYVRIMLPEGGDPALEALYRDEKP